MFERAITESARNALEQLRENGVVDDMYLGGGTALALQLGHRLSYDLDFFTAVSFEPDTLVRRIDENVADFTLERTEWGTLHGFVGHTRVTFLYFDYPMLDDMTGFEDVSLAGLRDIVAMKVAAVSQRGTRRDFLDLYVACVREGVVTLEGALELYDRKYGRLAENRLHILKALQYFEDAERDAWPQMFVSTEWEDVTAYFKDEVMRLAGEN